ncbi:MAG TPA: hypothetical protein VFF73_00850, partial [Planctomycetota bacterium]|nr:hypothetical protein [Planctomycetota bacterium]
GKRYRFATLDDRDEFLTFTVEDLGVEKVMTRAGEVGARKLRVKSGPEEELDWVADGRIVAQRWPRLPNMQSVAGTEAESRADWSSRPLDDADKAAERLAAGPARLEALVGELSWANYENGQKASLVRAKLTKEDKGFKFAASTSYVSSNSLAGTWALEEWTFSPDGKLVAASRKLKAPEGPELEGKLRVEGDKMLATLSLAPAGQEEVALALPPRIIADSSFLLRAVAGEKGAFRWNGINLEERSIYSVYLAPGDEETIALPGGAVKARRIDFAHGYSTGRAWVDESGKPLLAMWQNGDVSVFGPEDRLPDTLPRDLGSQKKEDR